MSRPLPAHVAAIHKQQQQQMVQQAAQKTLQAANQIEKQLDAQIQQMDNLGTDDLEAIRKRRIEEMKRKQAKMQEWKQKGHGRYQEISDQQEWFQETKNNERVVIHFYRKTTEWCDHFDKHLALIAPKHMETRFIKVEAEKCPFLAQRLSIVVMPTIIMTKDNQTHDRIEGLDEVGGSKMTTETLRRRLAKNGIIDYDGEIEERMQRAKERSQPRYGNSNNPTGSSVYGFSKKVYDSDDDEDDEY